MILPLYEYDRLRQSATRHSQAVHRSRRCGLRVHTNWPSRAHSLRRRTVSAHRCRGGPRRNPEHRFDSHLRSSHSDEPVVPRGRPAEVLISETLVGLATMIGTRALPISQWSALNACRFRQRLNLPPVIRSIRDQLLATAVLSSAARIPLASFSASSFAQKWMKKTRGCSVSM
jgi:hypothetical protein